MQQEWDKLRAKLREVTLPERGLDQLQKMIAQLEDVAKVEQSARMEGRTMFMMLAPSAKAK